MRKVKIEKWKVKGPDGKDMDESLLTALNVLIAGKDPKDMPRGLDQFRTMNRLIKAFDKADKSGVLTLEEVDYKFLKDSVEKDIPSIWGGNENISKAIEAFLESKEE